MTPACCIQLLDIGTQLVNSSEGNTHKRFVVLGWELVSTDQKKLVSPQVIYKKYNLSFSTGSSLKADIAHWLGNEFSPDRLLRFDLKSLVGRYCFFEAVATSHEEACLHSPLPVTNQADLVNLSRPITPFGFFRAAEPDLELLVKLPDYIQTFIKASPEFIAAQNASIL